MPVDAVLLFDLADKIEHFLRAPHGETGNDHIAAAVERFLQNLGQLGHIVRLGAVGAVTIGGFHHHKIRFGQVLRVTDQRLVQVADIAGEHNGLAFAVLRYLQGDGSAAQQVAYIGKGGRNAGEHFQRLAVALRYKLLHHGHGVFYCVVRLYQLIAAALGFAVFPLGFLLLNVGGIFQHDFAQVHGGICAVNGAAESVLVQIGDASRMVNVGVGQKDGFNLTGGAGQVRIGVNVFALLHAAVHQKAVAACFNQGAAAGHFTGSAQKGQLHNSLTFSRHRAAVLRAT